MAFQEKKNSLVISLVVTKKGLIKSSILKLFFEGAEQRLIGRQFKKKKGAQLWNDCDRALGSDDSLYCDRTLGSDDSLYSMKCLSLSHV